MKCKIRELSYLVLIALLAGASAASAAKKAPKPEPVPLTEKGQQLEAKYAGQMRILQEQIKQALPRIDEAKAAEFLKAYQAEAEAEAAELKGLRGANKKKEGDPAIEAFKKAQETLALAATNAIAPSKAIMADLKEFLESDKLDGTLAKYFIISHATPRGLAEYAQQGKGEEDRIEKLFKDAALMFQMAVAGGASGGQYGKAVEIYEEILRSSDKVEKDEVLQRLALGTALEHAVPVGLRPPEAQEDAPKTVDPVKRYLHFEKAYLDGELDPGFKDMTVWDYRMVGNGEETEEVLAWGRKMLRDYRPDHVSTSDYKWRYVKAVKTDVRYGSQYNKLDKPELQFFQNILANGGICGRRAFFGRFILRAFGVPTTRRPQPGHAALAHWTPDGWVVCLGAGWPWGTTDFGEGVDFDAHSRGRLTGKPFDQVRRAQIIGGALGEEYKFGFHEGPSGFWNGVALYTQRRIADEAEKVALAAVGTDIGEANESKVKDVIEEVVVTDEEKAASVDAGGAITLPAVACTFGTNSPGKVLFMESNLGGKQIHYSRTGQPVDFEYAFDAPKAGKYALTARVATPTPDQSILIKVNGAEEPVQLTLPYTIGMWGGAEPVEVTLKKGRNIFVCSRGGDDANYIRGVTIKDFTLKPSK